MSALEAAITDHTCAVLLEPVQGEGGVHVPAPDYLKQVRGLCDQYDLLLILDEVQTGMGRTGKWFGYEHFGIEPDIMTLAKGLGAGMPIGACLATDEVASAFEPGDHATTFGGNYLACAAALATIETMEEGHVLANATERGEQLAEGLNALAVKYEEVGNTRGLGLANMLAAYEEGVTIFDVSAGGLGGCPFVKGASGNVAAEDAVNLFEQIGVETGIDLKALCKVVDRYEELLGRSLPGRMNRVIRSQEISCG